MESISGALRVGQYGTSSIFTITSPGTYSFTWKAISSAIGNIVGIGILNSVNGNSTYKINWVKLEIGSIATPFTPPDPAIELLKCQRYYYQITNKRGSAYTPIAMGYAKSADIFDSLISLPVSMRVYPTFSCGSISNSPLNLSIIRSSSSVIVSDISIFDYSYDNKEIWMRSTEL